MKDHIVNTLHQIEQEHNLHILFACEAGPRAWGFPAIDSIHQIRFIYVRNPDWYLSIFNKEEVLDLSEVDGIDLMGWDIRKVLRLLIKSDFSVYEWMQSPVVYLSQADFVAAFWQLLQRYFQAKLQIEDYLLEAQMILRDKLLTEEAPILSIHYFQLLRPLLAAKWICENNQTAPMAFQRLVFGLEDFPEIQEIVHPLWQQQLETTETAVATLYPELLDFAVEQMEDCFEKAESFSEEEIPVDALDAFFRTILQFYA